MSLRAQTLGVRAGDRWLIRDVSLEIRPGRLCVLLGGNGAGKTTLLRALAGDLSADEGEVTLDGRRLSQWSPRELAQRRAVLTQHDSLRFPFTAAEVVGLSSLPWTSGWSGSTTQHAEQTVNAALKAAHAEMFAHRLYTQLSGGERGRVRFARALAQVWKRDDAFLLLDEPVAHLDFAYQYRCLAEARRQAQTGVGVLAVLHDPNLAARYADDIVMLRQGQLLACGAASELLNDDRLSQLYDTPVKQLNDGAGNVFFHVAAA